MRSCKIFVSTDLISPTYPISRPSTYFFSTFSIPPSMPLIPAACTPRVCTLATRSLLTFPSTICAISIVSLSVTRSPPTNSVSLPALSTQRLISLPPPCTMMGLNPTSFSKTTSCMTSRFSSSSIIALPPYFTTIILS